MSHSPTELDKSKYIEKLWGGESVVCNNEIYCAKFLFVKPGFQCSLHRHLVKDETFIVRTGEIALEFGDKQRYLSVGDSERIRPRTWHRFANNGKELAVILEVSTHHSDEDVQRREPSTKILSFTP